jgi:hypothetical protein
MDVNLWDEIKPNHLARLNKLWMHESPQIHVNLVYVLVFVRLCSCFHENLVFVQ